MTTPPLLSLSGIGKRFAGVAALDSVAIDIAPGEVHGLIGENGAGKSTLLRIIAGAQTPDAGAIRWDGRPVAPSTPLAAQALGIATIHQEFSLIPALSVAENLFLGREPRRLGLFVDRARMHALAERQLHRVGLAIAPGTLVSALSVGEQQMVEIARALTMDARLVVMDEPTAALTEAEAERLLTIMQSLRQAGVSVLFVTHRLREAMQVCDRFTVLRDGRPAGAVARADATVPRLIDLMAGRAVALHRGPRRRHPGGAIRLSARGLATSPAPGRPVLRGVDIDLRAGEILGVAGLVGAGRTELARALFGAEPAAFGEIRIDGQVVAMTSPREAIGRGVGLLPEDRKQQALFLDLPARENFSIARLRPFARAGLWLDKAAERRGLDGFRALLDIRMGDGEKAVRGLSGGNQQKIVLARWLALSPTILIVDEPTRGIDVRAKAEVHALLDDLAGRGVAVMVISSDLDEILAVSDRIMAMRDGRISGEVAAGEASQAGLMAMMTMGAEDAGGPRDDP